MDMITPKQAELLDLIEAGHATIASLAAATGLSEITIQSRTSSLEEAGLLNRTKGEKRTKGRGRRPNLYTRTSKPRPKVGKRAGGRRGRTAPSTAWRAPSAPATPPGVFDAAPRLTIATDAHWGTATREHVELAAREALTNQPAKNGRQAITARHLANLTGMPYLDALGALYRITERQTGGIRVYEPEGRSATFYLGPKYKPHRDFGARTRPKPTPSATV